VGLHRVDLCHDVDGFGCDFGWGHLRLRHAENYCDDLDHDRCPDYGSVRDLDCDRYCDFGHDHFRDLNPMVAHLHDVHLVQLVCLRVLLIQFPSRQEARRLRQVLLALRLEQQSLPPLAMQAWLQQALALLVLFVQESCQ
jgi:hypothetical protein